MFLETGDGLVSVGGWGAAYEDVEAHVIRVDRIRTDADESSGIHTAQLS